MPHWFIILVLGNRVTFEHHDIHVAYLPVSGMFRKGSRVDEV